MDIAKKSEHLLITTYRKELFQPFVRALQKYELIAPGDKIAVCLSGGKDSLLLAKLMQEIQRHGKMTFDLVFLAMDPGYSPAHRAQLAALCELLGIPVIIKETNHFRVAQKLAPNGPCYLCARMRRGFLYELAESYGCNKIALGHTFDDVVETILLNVLKGGEFKTMMPKLPSTNFTGLELIRPLYLVEEKAVIRFFKRLAVAPLVNACPLADTGIYSARREVKALLQELERFNPHVKKSIFHSSEQVNLNCVLGYKKGTTKHFFLDEYVKNLGEMHENDKKSEKSD